MDEDNVIILNPEFDPEYNMVFIPEDAQDSVVISTMEDGTITIETTADWHESRSILYEAIDYIKELIQEEEN